MRSSSVMLWSPRSLRHSPALTGSGWAPHVCLQRVGVPREKTTQNYSAQQVSCVCMNVQATFISLSLSDRNTTWALPDTAPIKWSAVKKDLASWKKCSVCLSASYFQLVNHSSQDAYDISLSDCTPYLFPLQYPHLKQSISPTPSPAALAPAAALTAGLVL